MERVIFHCCLFFALTAQAEVVELSISQVDVYLPDIKIYSNLMDENKQPLSLDGLVVRVNLDGNQVELIEPPTLFGTTGKGVAYTFLLDVSGSMKGAPYRGAIDAIAGLFNHMNENEVVAVLTFGDEVRTMTDFTRPSQRLFENLREITPNAQKTHFYEAIQQAFVLNKRREIGLPTRRAILVITDGKDEGSGIRLDDLLANEIRRRPIPIYSVGFSKLRQDKEKFLDELKRISILSGGAYVRSDVHNSFAEIYAKTFGDIQQQMYVQVRAPEDMRADGQAHVLQVVVGDGAGNHTSDTKNVFFLDAQVGENGFLPWHYMALGGILLFLIIWLIVRKSKPPKTTSTDYASNENLGETALVVKKTEEHFSRKMAFVVTDSQDEGLQSVLSVGEKGILMGRKSPGMTPDIVLNDPKVSRPHCLLQAGEDWFRVENQSTVRPTFVNGIRINEAQIFKDDECVINIGDTTIRINFL